MLPRVVRAALFALVGLVFRSKGERSRVDIAEMTPRWQASTLWLGAAATAAASYPYSSTEDCGHWHDGSFLVLVAPQPFSAAGEPTAHAPTGVCRPQSFWPSRSVLAIAVGTAFAVVAVTVAYAGAVSACGG